MFQLKLVDKKSKEAEFARNALFAKHSEMMGNWPKNQFPYYSCEWLQIFNVLLYIRI